MRITNQYYSYNNYVKLNKAKLNNINNSVSFRGEKVEILKGWLFLSILLSPILGCFVVNHNNKKQQQVKYALQCENPTLSYDGENYKVNERTIDFSELAKYQEKVNEQARKDSVEYAKKQTLEAGEVAVASLNRRFEINERTKLLMELKDSLDAVRVNRVEDALKQHLPE